MCCFRSPVIASLTAGFEEKPVIYIKGVVGNSGVPKPSLPVRKTTITVLQLCKADGLPQLGAMPTTFTEPWYGFLLEIADHVLLQLATSPI